MLVQKRTPLFHFISQNRAPDRSESGEVTFKILIIIKIPLKMPKILVNKNGAESKNGNCLPIFAKNLGNGGERQQKEDKCRLYVDIKALKKHPIIGENFYRLLC